MSNRKNAYAEVYTILQELNEEEYNKIPPEVIKTIEANRNEEYEYELDDELELKDQPMLSETKAILFNLFRDYLATPEQKAKIIRMQNEARQKNELKNKLKISKDNIVLTYVAELNKNKNQLLLIEMMDELKKYIKDIKLLLVGDGIYIKKYKNEVKKRNLQRNIIFLGKRKDIPEILSVTDIYVASSIREGLPLNIMEAMYMNLPVVAYDNRGHRELVENKVNGYIVNSKKDLVEKMRILINDKNLRNDFGKKSKEKSLNYELEKIIKQMEKIYMEYDK